jgi:hypothetical protein
MKERPILFSGQMVKAILDGRKTQTRRIVNRLTGKGPARGIITEFQKADTAGYDWGFRNRRMLWNEIRHAKLMEMCPYGQPGDRLWVRETFIAGHPDLPDGTLDFDTDKVWYRADGDLHTWYDSTSDFGKAVPWKPSIHMPRSASRITLEITEVRVERLQDISETDAIAEGLRPYWKQTEDPKWVEPGTCIDAFKELWESINSPGSWDVNPWVWVIEFRKVDNA